MHDRINAEGEVGVVFEELLGDSSAKSIAPAVDIEPQQMIAIKLGFGDPQLSDQAATRKRVSHQSPPGRSYESVHYILRRNINAATKHCDQRLLPDGVQK